MYGFNQQPIKNIFFKTASVLKMYELFLCRYFVKDTVYYSNALGIVSNLDMT